MIDPGDPSRRDFLAASAIGLIGLARGSESPALRDEAQTDGNLLYVGTYTEGGRSEGIYLVRMDRRSGEVLRDLSLTVDGTPAALRLVLWNFPDIALMNAGRGQIVLGFAANLSTGVGREHSFSRIVMRRRSRTTW